MGLEFLTSTDVILLLTLALLLVLAVLVVILKILDRWDERLFLRRMNQIHRQQLLKERLRQDTIDDLREQDEEDTE